MSYQSEDHQLQQKQNDKIDENTRLTKWALWVAILFGILQVLAQILFH